MARFYKLPLTKPYFPRSALSAGNLEYWIGHQEQIDRVVRGLVASNDTHYLITGYPGVGKSSFVSRAIAEWRKVCAAQGIRRVLIFNLHFAQPQTPEEVVRRLIGKVYFASVDGEFAPTKKLANRLELNYIQAYSKSLKETQGETSTTESRTDAKLTLPALTGFGGNLGAGSKESKGVSRSLEIQKEYNLNMATSDFESVLHLLTQAKSFESGLFERIKRQFSRSRNDHINSRTLFIFDQMDDLGAVEQLDSFFNMPNASFIVLGGPKLQEAISSAREQGVHVLDSFDEVYLPCRWNTAREMLAPLVDSKTVSSRRYLDYSDYLNFCSQGLPRRLFAAMDRHTTRKGDHFYLGVSDSEQKRIKLCAELHRILWKHRKDILGSYIDSVLHPFRDKALRGAYHLTDRIFRVVEFSFQEANTVATQMSATIMHPSRERVLRNLLKLFESYGMLLKSGSGYRLSEGVLEQVKQIPDWLKDGFADANELLDEIRRLDEKVSSSVVDIDLTPKHRVPPEAWQRDTGPDMASGPGPDTGSDRGRDTGPETGPLRRPGRGPGREPESGADLRESGFREGNKSPIPEETHIHEEGSLNQGIALRAPRLENQRLGGRYVVKRLLGRGGMSEVYLAHDSRLHNKAVVVKLLRGEVLRNDWMSRKFQQEKEALVRADHPGIVRVLDSGETAEGLPYIVMEYVEGGTLRTELRSGGMPLDRIRNIVGQVSNALEAAHTHGIIHRDLKPENIMIRSLPDGNEQVRIIDFGIAKIRASVVSPDTVSGITAGTTAYMAPEQIQAGKITVASDIYALGIITYEMITGQRPYSFETIFQLFEMQRAGVKTLPAELQPALPLPAQAVLLRALCFNPRDRYRSAAEFGAAFTRALKE